jgi:diamine N-acetyltransferase
MKIIKYTRDNYDMALELGVYDKQKNFVPSIQESLAHAYIKPWDEAFDPYLLEEDTKLIGAFYISYTPGSKDNYWLGGFFIDKNYQGKGLGKEALIHIIDFIKVHYQPIESLSLTVEVHNHKAMKLYQSLGFTSNKEVNRDGEIIYTKEI